MNLEQLTKTANEMVTDHKGLLAADESTGTIGKRFDNIGVENDENNRRDYRELLFRAERLGEFISGTILYDETIRQSAADGTSLVALMEGQGIIPGIKVDGGAKDLPGSPGEKVTEGLDGLPGRVEEYVGLGARFAKWRAVITIGEKIPSAQCIHVNAHADFHVVWTEEKQVDTIPIDNRFSIFYCLQRFNLGNHHHSMFGVILSTVYINSPATAITTVAQRWKL